MRKSCCNFDTKTLHVLQSPFPTPIQLVIVTKVKYLYALHYLWPWNLSSRTDREHELHTVIVTPVNYVKARILLSVFHEAKKKRKKNRDIQYIRNQVEVYSVLAASTSEIQPTTLGSDWTLELHADRHYNTVPWWSLMTAFIVEKAEAAFCESHYPIHEQERDRERENEQEVYPQSC